MSQNYIALATITLGSSASTITFSNIPSTYRDLILVFDGTGSGTVDFSVRFNSDTGSNYFGIAGQGTGSAAQSGGFSGTFAEIGVLTGGRTMVISQIMDYSATDKHKAFLSRSDGASDRTRMTASRWANTAAITTVQVLTSASFATGSTCSLYGISS